MAGGERGQGSIEFLMTYGWVILAILVVMVVLWQWGLLGFSNYVEPGSFGFWGVVIQGGNEFKLDQTGTFQASLMNTVGANVTVLSVNLTIGNHQVNLDPPGGDICITVPHVEVEEPGERGTENNIIPVGRTRILSVSDPSWTASPGSRFDAHLIIKYTDSRTGDVVYQSSGGIWGNAEPD